VRLGPLRPLARWATRGARARPTFLVIGAQKTGTTSLRRYLVRHPAVLCGEPKEIHFFDRRYANGTSWYLAQYPWRTKVREVRRREGVEPAVGEATPEYVFLPRVAERVHEFDPELKLVVILRDPVDRAYSSYQMQVKYWGEVRPFEEVLELEKVVQPAEFERMRRDPTYVPGEVELRLSYVTRGLYAEQLERWFRYFPREQFLVLTSEEFLADIPGTMATVTAFLGIPDRSLEEYPLLTVGSYEPMQPETRRRLTRFFEPHNRRLEELLGRRFDWARASERDAAAS
jgi:sulfotransferase family protein